MGSKTTEQKKARALQKKADIPYTMALRLVREGRVEEFLSESPPSEVKE